MKPRPLKGLGSCHLSAGGETPPDPPLHTFLQGGEHLSAGFFFYYPVLLGNTTTIHHHHTPQYETAAAKRIRFLPPFCRGGNSPGPPCIPFCREGNPPDPPLRTFLPGRNTSLLVFFTTQSFWVAPPYIHHTPPQYETVAAKRIRFLPPLCRGGKPPRTPPAYLFAGTGFFLLPSPFG